MGEFLDAVKQEAAKRPKTSSKDEALKEFLGKAGWDDFVKACLDHSISTSVIHRVIKSKGFPISYSAVQRMRAELAKS